MGVAFGIGDGDYRVVRIPGLLGALVQAVDAFREPPQRFVLVKGWDGPQGLWR